MNNENDWGSSGDVKKRLGNGEPGEGGCTGFRALPKF